MNSISILISYLLCANVALSGQSNVEIEKWLKSKTGIFPSEYFNYGEGRFQQLTEVTNFGPSGLAFLKTQLNEEIQNRKRNPNSLPLISSIPDTLICIGCYGKS